MFTAFWLFILGHAPSRSLRMSLCHGVVAFLRYLFNLLRAGRCLLPSFLHCVDCSSDERFLTDGLLYSAFRSPICRSHTFARLANWVHWRHWPTMTSIYWALSDWCTTRALISWGRYRCHALKPLQFVLWSSAIAYSLFGVRQPQMESDLR